MSKHKTPVQLNGTQLRDELRAAGVEISDQPGSIIVINDELILDINDKDKGKADAVVSSHVGIDEVLTAKDALLQRLGITAEEAALLIG
jgi:hypothetical protein